MKKMKLNLQLFADGKVVIETDLDSKGFKSGLSKMQSIAKTGFQAVATSVGVVSSAMAGLIGFGVKYNAEIEQLQTSFEVMTGSAEKAKDIIAELQQIGASTPFEVKGLAETTQLLMNYGLEADDAIDKMMMLGDIAQGSSEKMNRIAMAYGQMSSAGKVSLEDIKQMIEAGFNPLQEISKTTGESMASLYDRISKGTISVDEITASMERSTSAGGKYFQSMEKQSKTLNGQISTLKDNFSQFAGVLAEDTTNAISSEFLPAINETIQAMQEAFSEEGFEGLATAFADGFTNILTMLVEKAPEFINVAVLIIQSLITGFQENQEVILNSAFQIINLLINGLVSMLPQILDMGMQLIIQLMLGLAKQAPELVPQIVEIIIKMLEVFNENFDKFILAGVQLILGLIEGLIKSIPTIVKNLPTILLAILNFFTASKLVSAGATLLKGLGTGLINGIPNLLKNIPKIIGNMVTTFKEKGLTAFVDVGKNLVQGLWNGINNAKNWVLDKIKGFGSAILNGIKSFFGISSPSKLMKDEVGKYIAEGVGVGFEDELSSVYNDMQKAIDLETEKMSANVQTGSVYNNVMNTIPVQVNGNYTSTLEVDGEVLATVVNDVNDKKDLQYMF